jgi:hypothetical protein
VQLEMVRQNDIYLEPDVPRSSPPGRLLCQSIDMDLFLVAVVCHIDRRSTMAV